MHKALIILLAGATVLAAIENAGHARCMGGTLPSPRAGESGRFTTSDRDVFVFSTRSTTLRIPYKQVVSVEYGQEASRRVALAYTLSPLFLLSKSRSHFLTLEYKDDTGQAQALVLRLDKRYVRATLASLEARVGRSVHYQDENARNWRKGI